VEQTIIALAGATRFDCFEDGEQPNTGDNVSTL